LDARIKLAKRAAEEGWTVRVTEERIAKVLAKTGEGPRRSLAKAVPAHEYDYNGFHCALVGDEVVISGRNFKRTKDLVRQFVAEYQSALECVLRDIDAASADQPAADRKDGGAGLAPTGVAPSAGIPSAEVGADLMKQAAEVEAAGQPLKDLFSEIANKFGPAANANKDSGNPSLSDLLSFFNKPRSSG
jgi:hypothetical protein